MKPPPSPTDLLTELASAVDLGAVVIPPAVDRRCPELGHLAQELSLGVVERPDGREGLVCVSVASSVAAEADSIIATLARFERPPFVLLLPADPDGPAARVAAEALLARSAEWLVLEQPDHQTVALLAPTARLRSEPALPGEWRAAPASAGSLASEQETLSTLWAAAERDRRNVDEIDGRIRSGARKLDEARRARERMSAEIARLRESERHELDRVRLAVLEERAWVAEQAIRVASSSSWRIGHRLVRLGRMLTFRRDRGTNLPAMIAKRMEDAEIR